MNRGIIGLGEKVHTDTSVVSTRGSVRGVGTVAEQDISETVDDSSRSAQHYSAVTGRPDTVSHSSGAPSPAC